MSKENTPLILHKIKSCIVLILLTACQEVEIDVNTLFSSKEKDIQFDIVIEGGVVSKKGKQFVRLSRPIGINKEGDSTPISDATIQLYDGEKYYVYEESDEAGIYFTHDSISGKVGRLYTLTIEYNYKKYFASDSLVQVSYNKEDRLPVKNVYEGEHNRVYFDSDFHNFGYSEPNKWLLKLPSRDNNGNYYIKEFNTMELANWRNYIYTHNNALPQGLFPNGGIGTAGGGDANAEIEFIKFSLSDKYYKYLLSYFEETDWRAGIFSTYPGNTYTNVSEGGTGYFFASDIKEIKVKFHDLASYE